MDPATMDGRTTELMWAQGRGDGRLDSYPSMRGKGGARAKDGVERRWTGLLGWGLGGSVSRAVWGCRAGGP